MNPSTVLARLDQELLRCASVGTARITTLRPIEGHEPLPQLIAAIQSSAPSTATAVLQLAALSATLRLAGHLPAPAAVAETAAAPHDPRTELEPGLARALLETLGESQTRLQLELLAAVNAAGRRLPHMLLPGLLDAGRRQSVLRSAVRSLGGERARWLAHWNPEWRYAAGVGAGVDPQQRWLHGSLDERVAVLRDARQADPDAARAQLIEVLGTLPARERAELLGTLAIRPQVGDVALLHSCLADRGRDVVDRALALLMLHPDHAHARRASARLAAYIDPLGVIQPPEPEAVPASLQAEWKADGIELKRPRNEALGERAWWLYQLARQVPPSWWSEHWSCAPTQVVKRMKQSEWHAALLRALLESTQATGELAWVEALLGVLPLHQHPPLLACLPLAARERWWSTRPLKQSKALAELAAEICAACAPGEQIGLALAHTLVTASLPWLGEPRHTHYELRQQLPELLCVLPLAALAPIEALAHRDEPEVLAYEGWRRIARIIELRQRFSELRSAPS